MAGLSIFVALAVSAALWLVLRDEEYVVPPPGDQAARIQPDRAASALQDLVRAVRDRDGPAAASLAPDGDAGARSALRSLVTNAGRIPLGAFSLRYLDELGGMDAEQRWPAAVSLTWAFERFDRGENATEIEVRFVAEDDRVAIGSLGGGHGRQPVWLTGPVQVRRSPTTLVVASRDADLVDRLARRAVTVVRRVIPAWRDGLVVEVPATARGLDRALGAESGSFSNVAGVASPPDGTVAGSSPVHVFLNPERQRALRLKGTQIVLSHEAAHVALDAANTSLPVWLTEGFADYIALRDVGLPLETTASQVIRQVRREGPPATLPDDDDFDQDSASFGAAYEAAWLACRMLADRVGERALLRFYREADGSADFAARFRASFGTSVQRFTGEWRRALSDLAA